MTSTRAFQWIGDAGKRHGRRRRLRRRRRAPHTSGTEDQRTSRRAQERPSICLHPSTSQRMSASITDGLPLRWFRQVCGYAINASPFGLRGPSQCLDPEQQKPYVVPTRESEVHHLPSFHFSDLHACRRQTARRNRTATGTSREISRPDVPLSKAQCAAWSISEASLLKKSIRSPPSSPRPSTQGRA